MSRSIEMRVMGVSANLTEEKGKCVSVTQPRARDPYSIMYKAQTVIKGLPRNRHQRERQGMQQRGI